MVYLQNCLILLFIDMKNPKELKKAYNKFIDDIPELLGYVSNKILQREITFSLDELEEVQKYYEENWKDFDKTELLRLAFYAYMGEAFIKYFGGNWDLSKLKVDEAYGTPIIVNWGPEDYLGPGTGKYPWISISPFVWTEIIRKRGEMRRGVRKIFEGNLNAFKGIK